MPLHVRPRRSIATACACGDTVSGSVSSCQARELKTTRACESAARDQCVVSFRLFSSSFVLCLAAPAPAAGRLFPRPAPRRGTACVHFSDLRIMWSRTSDPRIDDPYRKISTRHASSWPLTLNLMTGRSIFRNTVVRYDLCVQACGTPAYTRSHVTPLIAPCNPCGLWMPASRNPSHRRPVSVTRPQ
jgi:hypothetical protein